MTESIFWKNFHTIIFDFDGVFTNNKVLVSEDGIEHVMCDRSDGLGIDILRRFIINNQWEVNYFILSTEKNPVVSKRAQKMNIKVKQAISNKFEFIENYLKDNFNSVKNPINGVVYLGNDINDLEAIQKCGYSVCPKDSHIKILNSANKVLNKKGGSGFVREFIEFIIGFDKLNSDEIKNLI